MCFDNRPTVAGITFNILLILLLYGLLFFPVFFFFPFLSLGKRHGKCGLLMPVDVCTSVLALVEFM